MHVVSVLSEQHHAKIAVHCSLCVGWTSVIREPERKTEMLSVSSRHSDGKCFQVLRNMRTGDISQKSKLIK